MDTLLGGIGIGSVLGWSGGVAPHRHAGVAMLLGALITSVLVIHWLTNLGVAAAALATSLIAYGVRRTLSRRVGANPTTEPRRTMQ